MRRTALRLVLVLAGAYLAHPVPAAAQQDPPQDAAEIARAILDAGRPAHPPLAFEPSPDSDNAAARYLWLFARMDDRTALLSGWIDDDAPGFTVTENEEGYTAEEAAERLAAQQEWIGAMIQATKLDRCEFGLNPDPRTRNFDSDDPRSGKLTGAREAARILNADAQRLLAAGDRASAAARAAAIVRLGNHYAREHGGNLHHIVANAVIDYGLSAAQRTLPDDRAALEPGLREEIIATLDDLDPTDPAGIRAAWNRHRLGMAAFVRGQIESGEIGDLLLMELAQLRGIEAMVDGAFSRLKQGKGAAAAFTLGERERAELIRRLEAELSELSAESVGAALARAEELGAALDVQWDAPDAEQRFRAAQRAIHDDPTGIMNLVLLYPRGARTSTVEARDAAAALRQRIGADDR